MKKLTILPMLMFFYACSTDSVDFEQDQYESTLVTMSADDVTIPNKITPKPCYKGLSSHVYVDVSGGFGNPVVVFQAVIPSTVPSNVGFRVKAEIQPLSDIDDMNSINGPSVLFGSNAIVSAGSLNPPTISVLPSQLPSSYKWRLVYEGYTTNFVRPSCISYTTWKEAPLF